MGSLDGKVAIVTGAGQGIGRGIAHALAKEGARVAIPDINEENAKRVAGEIEAIGPDAFAAHCDVRRSTDVGDFVAATVQRFGTVDVLVNNAMAARVGITFEETDDDALELALSTGPAATFFFMRACFPYLESRDGRVVNLRSGSEIQGLAGFASYVAAKAAIGGLTRVAAREWGRKGITVNAVCPFALSPSAKAHLESEPGVLDEVYSTLSIPRSGDAELDIGRAVTFLVGPDAGFITGCTLMVDGGGSFLG